jgi:hypothetical protein
MARAEAAPSEFVYRMVQVPPNIEVRAGQARGSEAAEYLNELVSTMAFKGWEFYRIDTLGVVERPGCLAGLLGVGTTRTEYYVVCFRMLRSKFTESRSADRRTES